MKIERRMYYVRRDELRALANELSQMLNHKVKCELYAGDWLLYIRPSFFADTIVYGVDDGVLDVGESKHFDLAKEFARVLEQKLNKEVTIFQHF